MSWDSEKTENNTSTSSETPLPNFVTIVGRGVPGKFELTVDGELETEAENPVANGLVVSGSSVEGSIADGTERIWFSGEMANLRIVDWNGVEAAESACAPTAHVTYSATR